MNIDIITIFPEMFKNVFNYGIVSQGLKNDLLKINIHNLRDFTNDKHKQVDARIYGGGAGMVLMPEPLFNAIESLKKENSCVINLSPSGKKLNQEMVENLVEVNKHLIIICGRYEGIDQRVIDTHVDLEISIGDYVLSGGEFASMVLVDSIVRLIPGVIKNPDFNQSESFSNKSNRDKKDFKVYTRPSDFKGLKVPEVLLNGHHKKISEYREVEK